MKKDNILVTILARGGSKGIKNKNIKKLNGKPLIAYTIEKAKKWPKASRVICSTDSNKIADIARRYGAEVPFVRPKALAGDNTAKLEALKYTVKKCESVYRQRYNIIVDLDPTAPLRKTVDIDNALKVFKQKRALSVISVVKSRKNPYFNMVEMKKNGFFALVKDNKNISNRQKAPFVYDMNASIYIYNRDFLINSRGRSPFSYRTAIYLMDDITAFDIDNELDFKIVEFFIRKGIFNDG